MHLMASRSTKCFIVQANKHSCISNRPVISFIATNVPKLVYFQLWRQVSSLWISFTAIMVVHLATKLAGSICPAKNKQAVKLYKPKRAYFHNKSNSVASIDQRHKILKARKEWSAKSLSKKHLAKNIHPTSDMLDGINTTIWLLILRQLYCLCA